MTSARTPAPATTRLSADERREAVVAAALTEFAQGGLAGTSTDAIARRAGVSQPYLFQLFGTKKELFIAVIQPLLRAHHARVPGAGRTARAKSTDPAIMLKAMGTAYAELVADRDVLLLQLHAYAACGDPRSATWSAGEFARLYREVARLSGADEADLEQWFAYGMLCNLATADRPAHR